MPGRPSLIVSIGAFLLAGCGFGAVSVDKYELEAGSSQTCATLIDRLPDVLGDAVRRDVEPDSLPVAAWGQPAIVLRCGVHLPGSYRPDAQLLDINGIGWFAEEGDGGTFFTATDRETMVEVAIPDDYAPEGFILEELNPVIADVIPERPLR
ncbi:DUF3515 domain-containing protein [Phytoactinopolyspora halotolerans]|uniref:DUF3515 domain-containing protein n=1 Tax=Phytoactinopolyspora halotolerans TaxID=1981512 RepID=A0A6L9SED5_9ACTN|nr:DUF3515 domain-containing protein [Phytoactinopolyspora halotolerans]NEE03626.1 DUF3515 domain-containing protein [Phytoactinopolyspora halotolerans]